MVWLSDESAVTMVTLLTCSARTLLFALTITKLFPITTQPAITCSSLTLETLEQGVKYVQS